MGNLSGYKTGRLFRELTDIAKYIVVAQERIKTELP